VVLVGRDSDNAELRKMAEECVANVGPFAVLFGGDDKEVWRELLDVVVDVGLVGHFPDDFNPGLLCKRFEQQLAH